MQRAPQKIPRIRDSTNKERCQKRDRGGYRRRAGTGNVACFDEVLEAQAGEDATPIAIKPHTAVSACAAIT